MLNTIQLQENEKYSENKSRRLAKYDFLPVDLIAHEIYSALLKYSCKKNKCGNEKLC